MNDDQFNELLKVLKNCRDGLRSIATSLAFICFMVAIVFLLRSCDLLK